MDQKIGIRIESPEEDDGAGVIVGFAVIAIVLTGLMIYLLFIEFFDVALEPFLKGMMGLK